ncbi:MAG: Re/Si-specific NAD(P)(+) transhydrogenase subunit alpha [Gammaproteobacteria bacterium]|nr:Re/Si-specific NAD(P)(+) transhydrogenase subunit alpha [Gammaproteobacteria bacterium]MDH5304366.1 Re/Si-specific NAD(P)(+) transhydrogenase subunit alpha [Gammaproteobacteria bacterium]MDH5320974.1 Re/Si-specific NAD(P)(+) transhydrogenase subunit alpha [Gammaproteobacteria bacterium]
MKIGVPREIHAGERRAATTPEVAAQLMKLGFSVAVEKDAGAAASYSNEAYQAAGCEIIASARELWARSDIILKVRAPSADEAKLLDKNKTLISFFWPAQNPELLKQLTASGATVMAMDSVPRISRAQKMDALSSMANIGGYRAVVEAAQHFGRFFTGQITAAGKVPPAKVLVIGAGVAGLAAIGAAKSMGAIVRSFDTRPEVKEQVESMDAEFLMLDFADEDGSGEGGYAKTMSAEFIAAEMALFAEQARDVDIIITTALIPGKPAPRLITAEMVASMKDGSVVVDLAAEQGGNCELTEKDKVVVRNGVSIIGYTDLPSRLAAQASQLYGTNLRHLLSELCPEKNGVINVNMDDEVIRGVTVCTGGVTTWPPPAPKLSAAPLKAAAPAPVKVESKPSLFGPIAAAVIGGLALLGLGAVAPESFMAHFTVFVLACFVGYMVIWNVSPALHTPLMSVTNAISSIIVIGALLQISASDDVVKWIAAFTILLTSVNIAGGFAVTRRMLEMFRK